MGMRFVGLDLRDILSLGYQDLPVANLRRIMNTTLFLTNFIFLTVSFFHFHIYLHIDQVLGYQSTFLMQRQRIPSLDTANPV